MQNPHADIIEKFKKEGKIEYSSQNDDADAIDEDEDKEKERKKRLSKRTVATDEKEYDTAFCTPSTCARVVCNITHLAKEQEVSVTFKSVVWMQTIKKVSTFYYSPTEILGDGEGGRPSPS